ncbi:MAG: hypothetical protein OQK98_15595 [Gammaproteobacteria bacterium]|nr:hypothetical protein [Gammaproteobacteria bacterium]
MAIFGLQREGLSRYVQLYSLTQPGHISIGDLSPGVASRRKRRSGLTRSRAGAWKRINIEL